MYKNLCQTLDIVHNVHSASLHSFAQASNSVSGASARHQCQSLRIEPVIDVLQDRASHFLSACQPEQLETFTGPPLDLRQSVTWKLSAIGCVLSSRWQALKRETAMVNKTSISFHLNRCISTARDPRSCRRPCERKRLENVGGGLGKERGSTSMGKE